MSDIKPLEAKILPLAMPFMGGIHHLTPVLIAIDVGSAVQEINKRLEADKVLWSSKEIREMIKEVFGKSFMKDEGAKA